MSNGFWCSGVHTEWSTSFVRVRGLDLGVVSYPESFVQRMLISLFHTLFIIKRCVIIFCGWISSFMIVYDME